MPFDDLDRRIVGALQVDGRASWRRIAEVLDAPVTTVTRTHGSSTTVANGGLLEFIRIQYGAYPGRRQHLVTPWAPPYLRMGMQISL